MRKKHSLLAMLSLAGAVAMGAPISPQQALERMNSDAQVKIKSQGNMGLHYAASAVMDNGVASAYIYTGENNQGFAILSADDTAVPVYGYSTTGTIDTDNLPPALIWWLEQLGKQVEAQGKNVDPSLSARTYAPAEWSAVGPLMKTTWNQSAPYNRNCPKVNGVIAPTGCVATSFAQVMNYFQYPAKGRGSIRYSDNGVSRSMSISKAFEWDKMLDSYTTGRYTEEEANAVAYLMQACGYAVEMGYGQSASGAQSYKLVNGMVTYFQYSPDVYYCERETYSPQQWAELIYNNVKNVGPVIYDGRSIDGGHSFVCDGYDGNGYFHINWGWGGMSDGFFVLDSLSPESQGIGGAEGGFNYSQGAIINMHKPDGKITPNYDNVKLMGTAIGKLSGRDLTFTANNGNSAAGWGNASFRKINCEIGAIIEKGDKEGTIVSEILGSFSNGLKEITLNPYAYYSTSNMNPVVTIPEGLADGKYKVVIAARQVGMMDEESETPYPWQPVARDWGNANYVWLTVNGNNLSVENVSPAELTFAGKGLGSPLYYNRNALLDITVKNTSDLDLSQCFYVDLYRDGASQYRSDYILVSVDPNETVNKKALVSFFTVAGATSTGLGTYKLRLIDPATGIVLASYGDFTMEQTSAGFTLELDDLSVTNAVKKDLVRGERTFKDAEIVPDAGNFNINLDYTVTKGFFDSSIRIIMAKYDATDNKFISDGENYYYATPFLGQGTKETVDIPVKSDKWDYDAVYRITASYMQNGQNRTLGTLYIGFDMAGIEDVTLEQNADDVEYYNLQGVKISSPVKGMILIRKTRDRVEKILY